MNQPTGHENQHLYQFGAFRLDAGERLLTRDGERVSLAPKAFDTLLVLVQNSGHVLSKEHLLRSLWPDSFVEENNLTQQISQLRRALGENGDGPIYIETVPKLGYRFLCEVSEVDDDDSGSPRAAEPTVVISKRTRTHIVLREEIEEEEVDDWTDVASPGAREESRSLARLGMTIGRLRLMVGKARGILLLSAASALMGVVLLANYAARRKQAGSLESLKLIRLTTEGKAQNAAVSPDGKYVAYVSGDPGNQCLRVRQVATHSDLQIVPAVQAVLSGISFSHDGNFLYYAARKLESSASDIYRVPVLGGDARRVARNTHTSVGLSPDDHFLVYSRFTDRASRQQLYIASSDGEGQRQLTLDRDQFIGIAAPVWSPDGLKIAAGVWSAASGTKRLGVWVFDASSGGGRPLGEQKWTNFSGLTWLPDGKHLLMTASETNSDPAGQIWELSYPGGELRRITNDLTDYGDLSVTTDSNTLVTVGTEVPSNLWTASAAHPDEARQVTSGSVGFRGWSDLAWVGTDRLLYPSVAGGNRELWIMRADGSHPQRLTSSAGWKVQPSACPDGQSAVFTVVSGATANLWRVDTDGTNLRQLTFSDDAEMPACSADGKWAIYAEGGLWKVPMQGGAAIKFSNLWARLPVVSRDGKRIAALCSPEPEKEAIAVLNFETGQLEKSIPLERGAFPDSSAGKLQWTPAGNAVAYVEVRGGVSNIWSQPLDGSPAKPLTNFASGQIFSFAWSPDGRQLALSRGTISSDVILMKDFLH